MSTVNFLSAAYTENNSWFKKAIYSTLEQIFIFFVIITSAFTSIMVKRTTAIVFFALASILLLAHAVVPHHHHNKLVCFKVSHCQNDDFTDEPNSHSHSHDRENNHDDCVLKEPVAVFSNQWKTDFRFNDIPDRAGLDDFYKNLLYSTTDFRSPVLSAFVFGRITESSYPSLISASLGLRAPPVV